jgi:hypothetical protein
MWRETMRVEDTREKPCPLCDCCELENEEEEICSACKADIDLELDKQKKPDPKVRTWSS